MQSNGEKEAAPEEKKEDAGGAEEEEEEESLSDKLCDFFSQPYIFAYGWTMPDCKYEEPSDEDAEELCNKIALGVLRPEGGLLYDEEVTACAKYASMVLRDLWQDREVCLQDASHRCDFFNMLGDNVDREDHPEIPEDCRTNLDLIVHICDDLVAGNRNVKETLDKLPKDTSCLRPAAEARAKDKRKNQEFKELGDEDELWHFPVKKGRVLEKGDKLAAQRGTSTTMERTIKASFHQRWPCPCHSCRTDCHRHH